MTLIDNAREVLLKAWSIRLALLSALLSAMEVALCDCAIGSAAQHFAKSNGARRWLSNVKP